MLALPEGVGALGLVLLAAGAAAGLAAGVLALRSLGSAPLRVAGRPGAALVAAGSLGLAVAIAPFATWRIVHDIRYTSGIPPAVAERIGAYENWLDASVFDDLARMIPPHDRYLVRVAAGVEPESAAHAFRVWGLTWLLPRRAVTNPANADWIVTWGVDPRDVDAAVTRVWRIRPPRDGRPATYLASVRR